MTYFASHDLSLNTIDMFFVDEAPLEPIFLLFGRRGEAYSEDMLLFVKIDGLIKLLFIYTIITEYKLFK